VQRGVDARTQDRSDAGCKMRVTVAVDVDMVIRQFVGVVVRGTEKRHISPRVWSRSLGLIDSIG
jgi:hypothetical protein